MGRRPNYERRHQLAALRAQGLSLAEIGRHLGLSKQHVSNTLQAMARHGDRSPVRCRACDATISSARALARHDRAVLCLACLSKHPEATFGEHLRACRLAAGWSIADLAARSGVDRSIISRLELERRLPSWRLASQLLRALGVQMVFRPQSVNRSSGKD
jgi:transcriptional regulator with XRE-family HTH domain